MIGNALGDAPQHAYPSDTTDAAPASQCAIIGQLEEIVMAQAHRNAHLEAKLHESMAAEQKFMTVLEGSNNGAAGEHAGVDFQRLASDASHNTELEAAVGRHLLQLAGVGNSSSVDGKRTAALQMKAAAQAKQNAELQAQIKEMKLDEEAQLATIAQLRQEADRDVRRNRELEVEVDKMQQVVQDYLAQIGKLRDAVALVHQQEVSMKEMRSVERDLRVEVRDLKAVISSQSKRLVELEAAILAMSQQEQDYERQVSQLQDVLRCTEADAAACGRHNTELTAELGVSQQLQHQQQLQGQGPPPPPQSEDQPNSSVTEIGLCTATLPPDSQKGTVVATTSSGATMTTSSTAATMTLGGMAGSQPVTHGQEMALLEHMLTRQMNIVVDRTTLPAKASVSREPRSGGSVLIGVSSGCSSSAPSKCRSLSGSIVTGGPLGTRAGGTLSGSISGSFNSTWRKTLGHSGSVEVEVSTAGIQSPSIPQGAHRAPSPNNNEHQRMESSPSRMYGANSPRPLRVASPSRLRPASCTPPLQMVPPVGAVWSPPQRTPQTTTQTTTFLPFNTRGTSPVMGTKTLGGSICSMSSHVRKASPDPVYRAGVFQ